MPNILLSLVLDEPPNANRLPLEEFVLVATLFSSPPKLKAALLTLAFVVVVATAVWFLPPKPKGVLAVVVTAVNF